MLAVMTEQAIASIAFIGMVGSPVDPRIAQVRERVVELLQRPLAEAREAGRMRAYITTEDLVTAIGMIAALLAKIPAAKRRETADRAWLLLFAGMACDPHAPPPPLPPGRPDR
jgi:hypothetical protein